MANKNEREDQGPTRSDQPESSASHEKSSIQGRPARRWHWRRWLIGLAVVIVLLLVIVALLPTILSTAWGNRVLANRINASIPGSIKAEHISVGWLKGPTATDLKLYDPEGRLVADVSQFKAPEAKLLPIMFGSRHFGQATVDVREAHVRQNPGEPTNLQRALAQAPSNEPQQQGPVQVDEDLSGSVKFTADRITYEGPNIETTEMTDVNSSLDVTDIQQIHWKLQSNVRSGETPGHIDADVTLRDMFGENGQLQWEKGNVNAKMQLQNLPIAPVDRLLNQNDRLRALLGEELDANVRAEGPVDSLAVNVNATSERMKFDGKLVSDAQSLGSPGSTLRVQITPTAFAQLMQAEPGAQAPQLNEPFTLDLQLRSLTVPRRNGELLPKQAARWMRSPRQAISA